MKSRVGQVWLVDGMIGMIVEGPDVTNNGSLQEYLYFIESGEDVLDDKHWTGEVDHPPSLAEVEAFLPKVEDYTLAEIASMVEDENAEEDLEVLSDAIRMAYMQS